MRPYILLTPGPLTTSETVKSTMLKDWCTWDDEYNLDIVQDIRSELVGLATCFPDDYTSVLMQGSGTYAVEGALTCSVPADGKLLVLANGAYGDRMAEIARYGRIRHEVVSFPETETLCPDTLDRFLDGHRDVTHVAFVHCETTTGILNPLEALCLVVKKHGKVLVVDAMSSFGGIPFDAGRLGIDFLISSANKCIQGVPGFGFIIARKEALERCKGNATSLSLDIYGQWETMEKKQGKWRFTSPTHVVRAFQQALKELREEGGIAARHARYKANHRVLTEGMARLGYTPLLPAEKQSPIITSFLYPGPAFCFEAFYNRLKQKGFVIYPGKISQTDTFRIGTIGDVYGKDFEALIVAVESVLKPNE
ncbi:MAG: 2-aminoethylphosphonate--pyruvate transaminase [Tannerellaceae bacterium]|jgi:2-aminoethylphosphonate-pyruvate transaminase|nr:2-aminoethylphosphonate--pyruvate transaminase [Tannerellaceae bacterium]